MNEQRIQQLKDQLRQLMQQITDIGEEPPEEIQDLLLQVMQKIGSEIMQLRSQESPAEGIQPSAGKNQTPESPFASSNVNSFGYDPKNQKLFVKFQGKYPAQNGPVYSYGGVPQNIFDIFRKGAIPAKTNGHNAWGEWFKGKTPSLGAAMHWLIKGGGFPYQKLS
jgi:hypothetical protein